MTKQETLDFLQSLCDKYDVMSDAEKASRWNNVDPKDLVPDYFASVSESIGYQIEGVPPLKYSGALILGMIDPVAA